MKLHAAVRMGVAHTTYCEDFLIAEGFGHKSLICAVLDGCSMGNDSHFASALLGKVVRKVAYDMSQETIHQQTISWKEDEPESVAKEILRRTIPELTGVRHKLMLPLKELLSTMILWVHHFDSQRSFIISLGDGVISCDGKIEVVDQNNRPDYLAYHLKDDFEEWYASQEHRFFFENPSDLSIATDGVETFRPLKEFTSETPGEDAMRYLMVENSHPDAENMLDQKLKVIKDQGMVAVDDLAIIRVQFDGQGPAKS